MNEIKTALMLIHKSSYEPNYIGYYVTMNGKDCGGLFCETCIGKEVQNAVKHHEKQRAFFIDKYSQIEKTGFFNGIDCSHYPKDEIAKAKRTDLNKYIENAEFGCSNCDPDFSGMESEPIVCEDCGHYFYTNFEPDEDCANWLLGDLQDLEGNDCEELNWKLKIAFENYEYVEDEVKSILFKCAQIIIRQKQ